MTLSLNMRYSRIVFGEYFINRISELQAGFPRCFGKRFDTAMVQKTISVKNDPFDTFLQRLLGNALSDNSSPFPVAAAPEDNRVVEPDELVAEQDDVSDRRLARQSVLVSLVLAAER